VLQVSALRNVLVVGDPSAAGPVDLSAASGLVRIGKSLYVVADDENRPGCLRSVERRTRQALSDL